jgi:hypothetical protein
MHDEEIHNLHSISNIVRMTISRPFCIPIKEHLQSQKNADNHRCQKLHSKTSHQKICKPYTGGQDGPTELTEEMAKPIHTPALSVSLELDAATPHRFLTFHASSHSILQLR